MSYLIHSRDICCDNKLCLSVMCFVNNILSISNYEPYIVFHWTINWWYFSIPCNWIGKCLILAWAYSSCCTVEAITIETTPELLHRQPSVEFICQRPPRRSSVFKICRPFTPVLLPLLKNCNSQNRQNNSFVLLSKNCTQNGACQSLSRSWSVEITDDTCCLTQGTPGFGNWNTVAPVTLN